MAAENRYWRLVNALVDYACYCGTGGRTAQGMGQTTRLTGAALAPEDNA